MHGEGSGAWKGDGIQALGRKDQRPLHQLAHDGAQMTFAKGNDVPEALVLDRPDEPLSVGAQVRASGGAGTRCGRPLGETARERVNGGALAAFIRPFVAQLDGSVNGPLHAIGERLRSPNGGTGISVRATERGPGPVRG